MKLLVPERMVKFDLGLPAGLRNAGGGVGVKWARVEEALRLRYPDISRVSSLDEVEGDAVIVEPFWFGSDYKDSVKAFLERKFQFSMVYGTQEELIRWPASLRNALLENVTCITHNCEYLRKIYQCCGIYHSQVLCDPVPSHIFYPTQKVQRIFASGQISWEKNTESVIALFRALRGSGIETHFLGSATMWGETGISDDNVALRFRLQSELQSVTDVFHGNLSQAEVAHVANASMHYVHVAHYDVSVQRQQEAALGGAVLWGLKHPINIERPVFSYNTPQECADALVQFDDVEAQSARVLKYAERYWSYEAFLHQFDIIMKGI